MWLDNSLRWGKHLNETLIKTQKFLNILKVLRGSGWGAHPDHLRRLYLSLIRSRFDYGCYLYDNSAQVHCNKIDVVQNQSLRIIGGFIRSTPIHAMEAELSIPPLHVRRMYLAYKYCSKIRAWIDNKSNECINNLLTACQSNSFWVRKKIPLLVTCYGKMVNEVIYSSSVLDMFNLKTWVTNFDSENIIKINLECINTAKKDYEINALKYELSKELNEKYYNYYFIFTDGSKSGTDRGAAFYDANSSEDGLYLFNNCFKINSNISIMSVELIGISKAINYINYVRHNKFVICSDSKSSLQHISRCASGRRGVSIAYDIISQLNDLLDRGIDIKLQWVPSHVGLKGNERADSLAKIASVYGLEYNVFPNYSELLPKYRLTCYGFWKEYFNRRSMEKGIWYRCIQSEPPHVPWFLRTKLSRATIVTALRLRTGHMPLNKFAFLMKKKDSPNCDTCGVVEDVHHLLTECTSFEQERHAIMLSFNLNQHDVGLFNSLLANASSDAAKHLYMAVSHHLISRH
ncbi:uncharacterized protein LOC121730614 [Aricia agestis]|uniref:uncharacterized protein LOC121730614 n=1 Tax=Aricia agestis TaxID=91739 RepID=UPI001C20ADA5|nr:uncharacterized protein LOC121730614 [Aricia agestis]